MAPFMNYNEKERTILVCVELTDMAMYLAVAMASCVAASTCCHGDQATSTVTTLVTALD